ncbi:MAG TPA: cell division protein ZipA C-terminal FtsZ-binding domain-containing protein [Steroidobacteraceae bacterium]|nr:cell division protein ZipA C-terminal FtsZ-binding domain-containing protein [Steroidobacteraceae bacterium]
MVELRLILLGLGLLLIAGIWWRGTRAAGQASKDAPMRDGARTPPGPAAGGREPVIGDDLDDVSPVRERAVPPFEPLTIMTADFEHMPIVEPRELAADAEPVAAAAAVVADTAAATAAAPPAERTPQMIVTVRICALGNGRWSGKRLADALEMQGLAYGRHQVFHRNHIDGRSMFCVASLLEPGTFDQEKMSTQEFRGITAFAVLPGPVEPVQTIEAMIATARRLAESLTGMVQDSKGLPLSPQRAAALRDEVARFQATLG